MGEWPARIALIGCGAMGTAMVRGMARDGGLGGRDLRLIDAVSSAADAASAATGGSVARLEDAADADLVVLAVKPKDAAHALARVGGELGEQTVVLSVVAGWPIERIRTHAPRPAVVRTMPNLAVAAGAGLVAMADDDLDDDRRTALLALFAPLGTVVPMPEAQIGAATALAGSGPGFVALVAEGLEEGAVAAGFTRPDARRMVQAVLAGTAALLADGEDPAELRQRVSSPAGTTIEGLGVLERGAVRAHMADAVRAAARRASEL